jgi:hypothetical protein
LIATFCAQVSLVVLINGDGVGWNWLRLAFTVLILDFCFQKDGEVNFGQPLPHPAQLLSVSDAAAGQGDTHT